MELLFAMVEDGLISFDDPVSKNGPPLIDALFNSAMHDGPAPVRVGSAFFKTMFSSDHVARWLELTDGSAFARKDEKGRWLPSAFLDLLTAALTKVSGGPRKNPPKIPEGKNLDRWLSAVVPTLPGQAWAEDGVWLLARAFQSDLHKSANVMWSHVDVLSLIDNEPVLAHAHRAEAWDRFVAEGGNVNHLVDGKPLWEYLLAKVSADKPAQPTSFLGGFEQWFLKSSQSNPKMQPALRDLIMGRARRPSRTPIEHWMTMLNAAGPQSLSWACPGAEDAQLWEAVALSASHLEFFAQLPHYTQLLSAIGPDHLAHVKLLVLAKDLTSDQDTKAATAMSEMETLVQMSGWPAMGSPWVKCFCRLPLNAKMRSRLLKLARTDDDAWAGPSVDRQGVGRSLFFMIPKLAEKAPAQPRRQGFHNGSRSSKTPSAIKERLLTWQVLTSNIENSSWVEVGRGLAAALCNKMDDLHAVSRDAIAVVVSDPHGLATLEVMSKSIATTHQKNYLSWLDSVRLEATSACVQHRRSSPRL